MSAGDVAREYVVSCSGSVRPGRSKVQGRVRWGATSATVAGRCGRASCTLLKLRAQVSCGCAALSCIAIRILTGRRHQIRSHALHLGHPIACDDSYTVSAILLSSAADLVR